MNTVRELFGSRTLETATIARTSRAALLLLLSYSLCLPSGTAARAAGATIALPADASSLEVLAAREVLRYIYVSTGDLLPIRHLDGLPPNGDAILIGTKDQKLVREAAGSEPRLDSLSAEAYWIKTLARDGRRLVLVTGGDRIGTLYAAYALAEKFGVRFYLHGDVLPSEQSRFTLPTVDELRQPLFRLRGIQPFHDFPEGPDWWNTDDYLAVLSQLPKLRMNFFGLHTYPEGAPNAEPTVWIGPASEVGEGGTVQASYPSSYQNTLRGNWGYAAKKTSDFAFGARELFERDDFGADVMAGSCPQPTTPEACNAVFNRTATMLNRAFQQARHLGVKTCVGTETPLTIPKQVQERLRAQGKDPTTPAVLAEVYEGIFQRAAKAYPIDYYWFWTPEGWTWEGTKDAQVKKTIDDLLTGYGAARKLGVPFQLATCGWVLGPQQDRALFDKVLPKDMPVSCINREVGKTPVDKAFAHVAGRGKWAIPWMEDDPALTSPQLWVGRMRRDAADALRYGCDGLMGIHWRTRILAPNVAALAQAAWDQGRGWASPEAAAPVEAAGPVGGQTAQFGQDIADTDEDPVYQTVRYNLSAYRLAAKNEPCTVTLKFSEPHYREAGRRVFDVHLQGQPVITNLDVFAKVGPNRALDYTFKEVRITNGWVQIDFVPRVEFPLIAGIVVEQGGVAQKINCGGSAFRDFGADLPGTPAGPQHYAPVTDFYRDWAEHEFGLDVGSRMADILAKVDCRLPRPSDWVNGPGGIVPDNRPWSTVQGQYDFVEEILALRPRVSAACWARFEYWAETFAYMRAMARVNCTWAEYNQAIAKAKAVQESAGRKQLARELALPLRRELVRQVGEVYQHLLALVSNPGELGTVANWDQHLLPDVLTKPGEELAKLLEEPLPVDAVPSKDYRGPTRVFVPTQRTSVAPGETLAIKVIVLSESAPRQAVAQWRSLGSGRFAEIPLKHAARGVYQARLPSDATTGTALEYSVKIVGAKGETVYWPASAPRLNQTVVVQP